MASDSPQPIHQQASRDSARRGSLSGFWLQQTESIVTGMPPERWLQQWLDQLTELVGCDRASWIGKFGPVDDQLAVSHAPQVDPNSEIRRGLEQFTTRFSQDWQTAVLFAAKAGGIAPHVIQQWSAVLPDTKVIPEVNFNGSLGLAYAQPLKLTRPTEPGISSNSPDSPTESLFLGCLVLEWKEHRLDPANAVALRDSLALIHQSFALAQRWYTIDEATRSQSQLTLLQRSESVRKRKRLRRLLLAAAITILAASCFVPVPFFIQAPASLEPTLQHNVYTPFDGRISQLFVEEGQEVEKDKSLLLLDAPELAQRLQDIKGRLSTLEQERKGLRIAANQATGESNSQLPSLSRLTSQIEELSSQIESLAAQQAIVEKQLAEAEVKSPIAGTVVGWQLKSELLSRPVSRGSLLFRIARFDGPWLLRIRIADRDALHVLRHFETTGMAIRFRLVSDERELYSATITSIAKNLDFDPIDGDFLEAIASIDEKESGRFRFDSSARVLIPCGNAPLGYVLFRSWIDFLQQNFWL